MTTSNEHNNAPAVPQGEPEAYMVYGNYTRQPFRSIESAQAYMGGLLKSDPEGGYHIRPLFYATPAAPSQEPAVPQGWRDFLTELSKQKPEKPDYWSSCGQCERNSSTAEDLIAATPAPAPAQGEPFGYFRAEPFGWTDCAATDEGAIALYEHPAKPVQEVCLTDEFLKEAAGSPEGYKFAAKGISKIDVWPHGGNWFPLYSLVQVQAIIAALRAKGGKHA